MTVIRLHNGNVVLHSPCGPSPVLFEDIYRIGPVTDVLAPNWFHDLYLKAYRAAFPKATFWGPRLLRRQYPAIIDSLLDDASTASWADELQCTSLCGLLSLDETIVFHISTRTLIVADFLINAVAGRSSPLLTRLGYRFLGLDGQLKIFPILRWFGFSSRSSMKKVATEIIAWEPQRVIVGHGCPTTPLASNGLHWALRALL